MAAPLAFGTKIRCDFQGKGQIFPGTIMGVREDNGTVMYDILYDDGDGESQVPRSRIMLPGEDDVVSGGTATTSAPPAASPTSDPPAAPGGEFAVGAPVEVRYRGKEWRLAAIVTFHADIGSYDVKFQDTQELESGVAPNLIRVPGEGGRSGGKKRSRDRKSKKRDRKSKDRDAEKRKGRSVGEKQQAIADICAGMSSVELDAAIEILGALAHLGSSRKR